MSVPVRAVVFDLFDTLVDLHIEKIQPVEVHGRRVAGTAPALHEALGRALPGIDFDRFVETLGEVDREFRESRYAQGLELPTLERFETFLERLEGVASGLPSRGSSARAELAELLTQVHMDALHAQVRALDHHPELLASLRARVPLALCSNFSHTPTALRVLQESQLHDHLDVLVVSDATGIRKPRPEIFQEVLEALGTAPEETLHVGDNLAADVGGAHALGMRTAWVTRRVADPAERLRKHLGPAPDHEIADLSELVELLDALGA
jgi:putative hydrolase of the HAD superfamily